MALTGVGPLLRKELLEAWRTLRLPIVAVAFLIIGFGSPVLARFTPELVRALAGSQLDIQLPPPTASDAVDQLLKNVTQLGTLIAILLASGSVATEKAQGTAALLLTGPADRAAFLVAKVAALGLTMAVAVAGATLTAWLYTAVLFAPLPIGSFATLGGLVWLDLAVFVALTFLGSTLTRSALAAAGFGFAVLILLGVVGVLPTIGPALPTGLVATARSVALGSAEVDWRPVASAVGVIVVATVLAAVVFEREEL
jgi:ABC-2 type transport system permease protein